MAALAARVLPILKAEVDVPGPNPSAHGTRLISTMKGRVARTTRANVPNHALVPSRVRDPGLARDLGWAASPDLTSQYICVDFFF